MIWDSNNQTSTALLRPEFAILTGGICPSGVERHAPDSQAHISRMIRWPGCMTPLCIFSVLQMPEYQSGWWRIQEEFLQSGPITWPSFPLWTPHPMLTPTYSNLLHPKSAYSIPLLTWTLLYVTSDFMDLTLDYFPVLVLGWRPLGHCPASMVMFSIMWMVQTMLDTYYETPTMKCVTYYVSEVLPCPSS